MPKLSKFSDFAVTRFQDVIWLNYLIFFSSCVNIMLTFVVSDFLVDLVIISYTVDGNLHFP